MTPALFFSGLGAAALLALFYLPIAALVTRGGFAWGVLADPLVWHVLFFTYLQAFVCASTSAVVGMAGALLYADSPRAIWKWLGALSLVPFSLPPVLAVLGLLGVWGRAGLGWFEIYGWWGIVLGHTFFNFALFVRLVGQALVEVDRTEEKTALSLGMARFRVFFGMTWPKIQQAFWSAYGLAFLFCAASFLVVLVLGGGPRFTTIEVAIFQTLRQQGDLSAACALGGVQLVVALLLTGLWPRRPRPVQGVSRAALFHFAPRLQFLVEGIYLALLIGLVALPLGGIFLWGVSTSEGWGTAAHGAWVSLKLAVVVGVWSSFLAFGLEYVLRRGRPGRWQRWMRMAITLPLAVSTLLVLLGWRLFYPDWFSKPEMFFWAVACAQMVTVLPLVGRPLQAGFERVASGWYQVASSLGAGPWKTLWHLEFPAMRNPIRLAILFGALFSLGEAASVLLFSNPNTETLTYLVYQSMVRYRFGEAFACGAVLLGLTAVLALGVQLWEREKV